MADDNTAPTSSDRAAIIRRNANGVGTPGSVTVGQLFETVGLGYDTGAGGAA